MKNFLTAPASYKPIWRRIWRVTSGNCCLRTPSGPNIPPGGAGVAQGRRKTSQRRCRNDCCVLSDPEFLSDHRGRRCSPPRHRGRFLTVGLRRTRRKEGADLRPFRSAGDMAEDHAAGVRTVTQMDGYEVEAVTAAARRSTPSPNRGRRSPRPETAPLDTDVPSVRPPRNAATEPWPREPRPGCLSRPRRRSVSGI